MPLVKINRNPDDRTLRQFGAIGGAALPMIGWSATGDAATTTVVGVCGAIVAVAAWLRPSWFRLPFVALSYVTAPLGIVLGEALLLIMYFGVFLPVGLTFRLLRRDPLDRRLDRTATTYWRPKPARPTAAGYFRQF